MIVVDSSAIIAILRGEPDAAHYAETLVRHKGRCQLSVANYVEIAAVIDNARDPIASRAVDALVRETGMQLMPVNAKQAAIARTAYRDFGKGSGHAAGLNFGDCFAYALAKETNAPLLYKGDDFAHTDVMAA
jgi:ribonuclease VapC